MRKPSMQLSAASVAFGATLLSASLGVAADTHVIGVQGIAWTYKDRKSTPAMPVAVDDLRVGDIVEVQIGGGPVHHGFVTIKGTPPVEDKSPVLACGENSATKPNAALREIDCGAASNFGVQFTGKLRLEVMSMFKDPVDFYCVVHHAAMPGTLKLAP
jgi:hypothetical protein